MHFPLQLIPVKTNADFMGKRMIAFTLTLLLSVASLWVIVTKGFNFGIDFTGGIIMEIRTPEAADLGKMRAVLTPEKFGEVSLQQFGGDNHNVIIRIQGSKNDNQAAVVESVKTLINQLNNGSVEYRKVDYVGPQVGGELIRTGIVAVLLSFGAIMLYVWFRFEWQYGVGGIAALIHDTILTLGFISWLGLEFNLTTIAALLTIIGYSINDSVVIYDRIRENFRKYKSITVNQILNKSINETLSRTILTAGTTALAALSLVLFGGEVLKSFSMAMFFGVIVGTYSSIYISAPILIYFNLRNNTKAEVSKTAKSAASR